MRRTPIIEVDGSRSTGIECPKCGHTMSEKFEYYKCGKCGYWEGQDHAYERLKKEGRLG